MTVGMGHSVNMREIMKAVFNMGYLEYEGVVVQKVKP